MLSASLSSHRLSETEMVTSANRYLSTSSSSRDSPSARSQPRSPLSSSLNMTRNVSDLTTMPRSTLESRWAAPEASPVESGSTSWTNRNGRRRSSVHSFMSIGQASNAARLVGSFQESLLRGRMSMPASKPLTFEAELGVLGIGRCRPSVRCPPHINLTFPAHFYNLGSESASPPRSDVLEGLGSPYVGTIDLDGHYNDQLESDASSLPDRSSSSFPGYAVPPKGRLQLVVKYPNMNAVKLFIVPYDLTDMPAGTKTFIRQKGVFVHATENPRRESTPIREKAEMHRKQCLAPKETLRFALHLQFCSPPALAARKARHSDSGFGGTLQSQSSQTSKMIPPHIYLHGSIRVVFTARAAESDGHLVETIETPGQGLARFAPYSGPGDEWVAMLRKAKADQRAAAACIPPSHEAGQGIDIPAPTAFADAFSRLSVDGQNLDAMPLNSDPDGERWAEDDAHLDQYISGGSSSSHCVTDAAAEQRRDSAGSRPFLAASDVATSSNDLAPGSLWLGLRKTWLGTARCSDSHELKHDKTNSHAHRNRSNTASSEATGLEHHSPFPAPVLGSASMAEALVQPIVARGDLNDQLLTKSASAGQPALIRKLSQQVTWGQSVTPTQLVNSQAKANVDNSFLQR